eukprot:TRINITY_DN3087_c1_g2_i1.p1 TRINITY_DN3087_c1_g2~~TRINITY_DN3087_c1_g2_i1.p1  ORF type:complete len:221 (+),score=41.51 TRINITY_DN3087_c1_g2_i1:64-726(+)
MPAPCAPVFTTAGDGEHHEVISGSDEGKPFGANETSAVPTAVANAVLCDEDDWAKAPVDTTPQRPCDHNDWDDVRQHKGVKVLRCRQCDRVWRWARGARRGDQGLQRCIEFLNDRCPEVGSACPLLHVHRTKKSFEERVQAFGDDVKKVVPMDNNRRRAHRAKKAVPDARGANTPNSSFNGSVGLAALPQVVHPYMLPCLPACIPPQQIPFEAPFLPHPQ